MMWYRNTWNSPRAYAVKHKDSEVRARSRSGGIFTALSDKILASKGVVYGCILTEDLHAVHVRATTHEGRDKMCGSKYIQSQMGDVFKSVKDDLEEGLEVLFSGTSCQVSGLHDYLCKDYSNLICVDIVCHGVPSPAVWDSYLEWQKKRNKGKIEKVDFRNKTNFGWAAHVESLYLDNGKRIDSEIFKTLFYGHAILRPCCYKCPYKDIVHPGDITIADYWGIDKASPGFNDNKGVSLVLVNNEIGRRLFDEVNNSIEYQETRIEDSMQQPFYAPFKEPKYRAAFWRDFNKNKFSIVAKRYGNYGAINNVKKLLHRLKMKFH